MAAPMKKPEQKDSLASQPPVQAYLVAYNTFQMLGWSAMGFVIVTQLSTKGDIKGLYKDVSQLLYIFQTAALLEIVHCAVGMVRSNVFLTAMQVYSRVFLVWGIAYSVPEIQNIFAVLMFLFAWTVTEIVRYSFYIFAIIGEVPYILQWCRYTFFIVLYPIGVTGELLSIVNSLAHVQRRKLYYLEMPNAANMSFNFYYYLIFTMISYIPVFPQLYMHMLAQRKKIIGGAEKPKTE